MEDVQPNRCTMALLEHSPELILRDLNLGVCSPNDDSNFVSHVFRISSRL
jgi:hypothetical protein